ncbi:MAG: branched-chain amino acid ABC transporter permease [Methanobacteriota archaeon]|nr:MAG: branched-chain amino acid ABC transporter permease [Euryarchaeota archaeon]TLZ82302.1 MAG: branched-chain amino acid ABC transporter permease [Euryarchaeota archaeon]
MAEPSAVVAQLIFGIVRGILLGCVFALIAHGLNLIWGIAKVVNVAHGEFIMLGAYGAYFLNLFLGLNPLVSAPIDAALGLAVGLGFYFGFLHRELRGKEAITLQSEMVTLVATFGLSLFIANAANVLFSGNFVGIPWNAGSVELGILQIPLGGIYVAILSVAIIALTQIFLNRTYLGIGIRAYSQDIPATQLMGINPTVVAAIGTGLGFGVTMAGGAFLTVLFPTGIYPYMGALYAPISFVIVVLGGPGKMWGSLVGGITLGIIIDVGQIFLGPSIAYAVAFLTLIPVLLFRPEGILR